MNLNKVGLEDDLCVGDGYLMLFVYVPLQIWGHYSHETFTPNNSKITTVQIEKDLSKSVLGVVVLRCVSDTHICGSTRNVLACRCTVQWSLNACLYPLVYAHIQS